MTNFGIVEEPLICDTGLKLMYSWVLTVDDLEMCEMREATLVMSCSLMAACSVTYHVIIVWWCVQQTIIIEWEPERELKLQCRHFACGSPVNWIGAVYLIPPRTPRDG